MFFFILFQDNKEIKNPLVHIDIQGNMKKMEVVNLSQFTDDISYIPFETKDNNFVPAGDISVLGNRILVGSLGGGCLMFDSKGKFISKVGSIGAGPGEYKSCTLIGFGDDNKIYIQSLFDLYEFSNTGVFEKKYSKAFRFEDMYTIESVFPINNGLFFGHIPNSTGQIKYKALISDKSGVMLHHYNNSIIFNRTKPLGSTLEMFAHIYKFKSSIYYKEYFNDTLFCLNGKYELIPAYVFNLGKYKEPVSERAKIPPSTKTSNYLYIRHVFQTDKYLFIITNFNKYFPATRLTPMYLPMAGDREFWYNTSYALGIYDKTKGDLTFCKPTSTDNPLFTSGIYNDIDAGARFFPFKMINDSTMVMWIEAKQLKDHVASQDFKRSIPKYPEKKKALEDLANKLTIYDNPVLMVVTFNK